eukprot:7038987-Alexandrium_andersonii.AAC.1
MLPGLLGPLVQFSLVAQRLQRRYIRFRRPAAARIRGTCCYSALVGSTCSGSCGTVLLPALVAAL